MDRLTTQGPGVCYIRKVSESSFRCKFLGKNDVEVPVWDMTMDETQRVLNRLSEYEATGLTPAEVRDLNLVNKARVFSVSKENAEEAKELFKRGVMEDTSGALIPVEAFFHYDLPVFLDTDAILPTRAHDTDAGLDLYSKDYIDIQPGGFAVFDTGVHIKLPAGCYGKIESKSGLNMTKSIVSCGGVIDEGYTGSIWVKLYNLGKSEYSIDRGDKIAQLIVQPCEYVQVKQVKEWNNDTPRGDKGFGSTGR